MGNQCYYFPEEAKNYQKIKNSDGTDDKYFLWG